MTRVAGGGRPANFDRIARAYRWLEYLSLGGALERCRLHHLSAVESCGEALVLGDGDGRFLAALLARTPRLRATAVDTSAAMLLLLRGRCERVAPGSRLQVCHESALEHVPSPTTDLIVAHFFLDCLEQAELDLLVARLTARTRREALWLVSDFRIPPGALGLPARALVRTLYGTFRLLTGLQVTRLPDYEGPLRREGLHRVAQRLSLGGLLSTELWQRPPG